MPTYCIRQAFGRVQRIPGGCSLPTANHPIHMLNQTSLKKICSPRLFGSLYTPVRHNIIWCRLRVSIPMFRTASVKWEASKTSLSLQECCPVILRIHPQKTLTLLLINLQLQVRLLAPRQVQTHRQTSSDKGGGDKYLT